MRRKKKTSNSRLILIDFFKKAKEESAPAVLISAKIEEELSSLDELERIEFLKELGTNETGLSKIIKTGYNLLDLETFFTIGPKEAHAWTIKKGSSAPRAAGEIHTDFEKGFIRAEVIRYDDFTQLGSEAACKEAGKMAVQGKDYVVQDGDIMHFRFNV